MRAFGQKHSPSGTSASGRFRTFVTFCDFSALTICYAELNGRVRPRADFDDSIGPENPLRHCAAKTPVSSGTTLDRCLLGRVLRCLFCFRQNFAECGAGATEEDFPRYLLNRARLPCVPGRERMPKLQGKFGLRTRRTDCRQGT